MSLTNNAIENIFNANNISELPFQPIVQIIKIKPFAQRNDKLRVAISDGKYFLSNVIFSGTCADEYQKGNFQINSLVKLMKYVIGFKDSVKYYLAVEIEIIAQNQQFGMTLGAPQDITALFGRARESSGNGSTAAALSNAPTASAAVGSAASNRLAETSRLGPPQNIPPKPQFTQPPAASATAHKENNFSSPQTSMKRPTSTFNNSPLKKGTPQSNRQTFNNTNSYNNNLPILPNDAPDNNVVTIPINSITPYQSKWTIKARVEFKSAIRTYQNSKGEGKLFSVTLADQSGEIKATAFNECVEQLYNQFELKKTYYISCATLKVANKQFSKSNNDYEMTFNSNTVVQPCFDNLDLPEAPMNLVSIESIISLGKDAIIDVLGYIVSVEETQFINSKDGRQLTKRELTIADTSEFSIILTIWGENATSEEICQENAVILVKGAKVSQFRGLCLTSLQSSTITINPDIPEATSLMSWFRVNGAGKDFTTVSSRTQTSNIADTPFLTLHQINSFQNMASDKSEFIQVIGLLEYIKIDNLTYKACPTQNCNKKMIEDGPNNYRCEKCNRSFNNYAPRLFSSGKITDATSYQYVTFFNDQIEKMINSTAQEVDDAQTGDQMAFDEIINRPKFKRFVFKLRIKLESYNDEMKIRATCLDVRPINFVTEGRVLLDNISKLSNN